MPCLSSSAWLGTPSVGLENKIKASVEKCFFAVKQCVIFTCCPFLPAIKKDVLPALLLINIVYNFSCHHDSWYIGCTFQQLQDRICQHMPKFIKLAKFQTLAIFLLVLANPQPQLCLVNLQLVNIFPSFGHLSFHLSALEAFFIKSCKPT